MFEWFLFSFDKGGLIFCNSYINAQYEIYVAKFPIKAQESREVWLDLSYDCCFQLFAK